MKAGTEYNNYLFCSPLKLLLLNIIEFYFFQVRLFLKARTMFLNRYFCYLKIPPGAWYLDTWKLNSMLIVLATYSSLWHVYAVTASIAKKEKIYLHTITCISKGFFYLEHGNYSEQRQPEELGSTPWSVIWEVQSYQRWVCTFWSGGKC